MKKILAVVASVRFFVLVSVVLGAVALAATFVPQNLSAGEYEQRMGPALAAIVRSLGLHSVRSSPLLLTLVALVEASVLACTLPRLLRRLRRGRGAGLAAFAPDLIHIGLAIVIAGGFLQFAFGTQWRYDGPVGGELTVDGTVVRVRTAGEIHTARGVLAGWYIEVTAGGERVRFGSNAPARSPVGRMHFRNYAEDGFVTLATGEQELDLRVGEGVAGEGGGAIILVAADDDEAVFANLTEVPEGRAAMAAAVQDAPSVTVQTGDSLGSLTVVGLRSQTRIGFTVRRNPGRTPVLAGLVILAFGMAVYAVARVRRRL